MLRETESRGTLLEEHVVIALLGLALYTRVKLKFS